jgi:hypothetical protein
MFVNLGEKEEVLAQIKPNKVNYCCGGLIGLSVVFGVSLLFTVMSWVVGVLNQPLSDNGNLMIGLLTLWTGILLFCVILAAVFVPIRASKWEKTMYVITTDRVIFHNGEIAGLDINFVYIKDLSSLHLRKGLFNKMTNTGSIELESYFCNGTIDHVMADIKNPEGVYNYLNNLIISKR